MGKIPEGRYFYQVTKEEVLRKIYHLFEFSAEQKKKFNKAISLLDENDFYGYYFEAQKIKKNTAINYKRDIIGPLCDKQTKAVKYHKSCFESLERKYRENSFSKNFFNSLPNWVGVEDLVVTAVKVFTKMQEEKESK